jgi:hypothetical protein
MGYTPLHSAIREGTDLEALQAIIRAYPDALHMRTTYGDTPLHLACLRRVRPDIVRAVAFAGSVGLEKALAHCNGRISPILDKNTAGQTPIGIVMEEYQRICQGSVCCSHAADVSPWSFEQTRCFDTVACLVKMLHYGPTEDHNQGQSLVGACVALHRKGALVDPAFIHRALTLYPEEARFRDDDGNTPLHVEASIPVEKMSLLDSPTATQCDRCCVQVSSRLTGRMGVLRKLLEVYPEAACLRNVMGDFPLNLMAQNGRPWDRTFALVIRTYPEALQWIRNVDTTLHPRIFELLSNECGTDTVFSLIRSRPEFALRR